MTSIPTLAAIRFGTGLSPLTAPPDGAAVLLADLAATDDAARALPMEDFPTRWAVSQALSAAQRAARDDADLLPDLRAARQAMNLDLYSQLLTMVARGIIAPTGFRERLAWFWADHFTTTGGRIFTRGTHSAYVEDAIRPHMAGRFADMLREAVLHPGMMIYLDQNRSVGPNSPVGQLRGQGLNENLAREVLELHTLGAGADYTQTDVRELAELLTGAMVNGAEGRFVFRPRLAEPGTETVLGRTYGGDPAEVGHIHEALEALALHPQTARHIAGKLARHFVSETPEPGLVAAMTDTYLATGGDLSAVYAEMLAHDQAWAPALTNVKWPFEVVTSGLRALAADPARLLGLDHRDFGQFIERPLIMMGQTWQGSLGPDGYEERDAAWIGAQGLAARIGWAMTVPAELIDSLPDPRIFVNTALADAAPSELIWAVERAATVPEGVGLVLSSPTFNRR